MLGKSKEEWDGIRQTIQLDVQQQTHFTLLMRFGGLVPLETSYISSRAGTLGGKVRAPMLNHYSHDFGRKAQTLYNFKKIATASRRCNLPRAVCLYRHHHLHNHGNRR
jgi:hypothetical protein